MVIYSPIQARYRRRVYRRFPEDGSVPFFFFGRSLGSCRQALLAFRGQGPLPQHKQPIRGPGPARALLQRAYVFQGQGEAVLLVEHAEQHDGALLAVEAVEDRFHVREGAVFDAQAVARAQRGAIVIGAGPGLQLEGIDHGGRHRRRAVAEGHQFGHAPCGADGVPATALLGQLNKEVAREQGFLALHAPAGAYFFQAELGLKAGKTLIFQVFLGPVVLVGAALHHVPA